MRQVDVKMQTAQSPRSQRVRVFPSGRDSWEYVHNWLSFCEEPLNELPKSFSPTERHKSHDCYDNQNEENGKIKNRT